MIGIQHDFAAQQSAYDGLGRRIVKAVTNSADLDATYHYYYNPGGQRMIEMRNGSDAILKQQVWAPVPGRSGYIDELVQVAVNDDPVGDADMSESENFRGYWTMQDANYNVLGLVDDAGALVERYEYTPYGERTVYFSPGTNDPLAMAPTTMSRRVELSGSSGVWQPYGLNEIGHQGLMHDEESGLVYNRARMRSPRLGRWLQRERLGYVDGMSLYQYVRSNPIYFLDPSGGEATVRALADDDYFTGDYAIPPANSKGPWTPSNTPPGFFMKAHLVRRVADNLKALCNSGCLGKCPGSCTKIKCESEAEQIAIDYVRTVLQKRRRRQSIFDGFMNDESGGRLCYDWRAIVYRGLTMNSNYDCFKVAAAAETNAKGQTYHNWVNVTVSSQAQRGGDCTRRLDPWTSGGLPSVYDDASHGRQCTALGRPLGPPQWGWGGDLWVNGKRYPDMWHVPQ